MFKTSGIISSNEVLKTFIHSLFHPVGEETSIAQKKDDLTALDYLHEVKQKGS